MISCRTTYDPAARHDGMVYVYEFPGLISGVSAQTLVLPTRPPSAILNQTALEKISHSATSVRWSGGLRSAWEISGAIIVWAFRHVSNEWSTMACWPQCPSQTNGASSSGRPCGQVCWFRTNDPSCGIAAALQINQGEVENWAVALDWADDTIWYWARVWVGVRLISLSKPC